ncbi:MAG: 6-pyruvoyl tetrahydropterin synthase family protein [Candidatus Hodarchaeota archaeon]
MKQQFAVEVSGVDFAAAHFVSEGGKCESLHGHNYLVKATVHGQLDDQGMVIDFRVLKKQLRQLCQDWDHRVLLPTQSKMINVERQADQFHVKTPTGNYSIPASDVVLLDVLETTAEELARVLCQQLSEKLMIRFSNVTQVSVTLAESSTSRALVSMTL